MPTNEAKNRIFASLMYDNPAAAVEWLCRVLGFETNFIAKDADGKILHAELRLGPDIVMIEPVRESGALKSPRALPGQSQFICIAVEDVDSHFARVRSAGATIDHPPVDTHYGARLYSCHDIEGHFWTVGNYWPQNSRML